MVAILAAILDFEKDKQVAHPAKFSSKHHYLSKKYLKNDCNQTLQGSQAVPPDYIARKAQCCRCHVLLKTEITDY